MISIRYSKSAALDPTLVHLNYRGAMAQVCTASASRYAESVTFVTHFVFLVKVYRNVLTTFNTLACKKY
jgi:uncharacterized membrane protein YdfJ with MMPL/SSD domain